MALTKIKYGDVASSEVLNNNFKSLEDDILETKNLVTRLSSTNGYDDSAIISRLDGIYLKTDSKEEGIIKDIKDDIAILQLLNNREYDVVTTYTSNIGSYNVAGADSNKFKYLQITTAKNSTHSVDYNQQNLYRIKKHYKNGKVTMLEQGGSINLLITRKKDSGTSIVSFNFLEEFASDEYSFTYKCTCPKYPSTMALNGHVLNIFTNSNYNSNPFNTAKKYVTDIFADKVNFKVTNNATQSNWMKIDWEARQYYSE